jgi:hypothetical protein
MATIDPIPEPSAATIAALRDGGRYHLILTDDKGDVIKGIQFDFDFALEMLALMDGGIIP